MCVHCNPTPPHNSYLTKTKKIQFYKIHLVDVTYEDFPSIICNTFKYVKGKELHMGSRTTFGLRTSEKCAEEAATVLCATRVQNWTAYFGTPCILRVNKGVSSGRQVRAGWMTGVQIPIGV
jgi:hypothetical protein